MKENMTNFYYTDSESDYTQIFNEIRIEKYKKCIVFLNGEIGSGKTTIVREYIKSLNLFDAITSPTFTLINEYQLNGKKVFHYDLYRIKSFYELSNIGMADYLNEDAIHFFEWPKDFKSFLPEPNIIIDLTEANPGRLIKITITEDE